MSRSPQTDKGFKVGDREITVFEERDPKAIGWGGLDVDVVIESTGRFTTREGAGGHLEAGAKRVIISAPGKEVDATFVVGVNDDTFDPGKHFVVSAASCTTNCLVPMVKVLEDSFGLRQGLMTTIHAYTNDQSVLDLGRSNLRRARAAAVNIIPSTTGAARATSLVVEAMKGRLDGQSLRVPVSRWIDHGPDGRVGRQGGRRPRSTRPSGLLPRPSVSVGSSSTTRTRSSRATSSAVPPRAPSTRRSRWLSP